MAPLQRIDDLLEQLLLFRQRFLAAADEEHELPPVVLEPLRVDRLAAHVLDQVPHALLVAGSFEQPGEARADAGGDHRRDRSALAAAGHPGAIHANVNPPPPLLAHQRKVPADRLELPIDRGDAHAEQRGQVGAREVASREQRGDELRGPFDGGEPSELRDRHDPQRILRSAKDLKARIGLPLHCRAEPARQPFHRGLTQPAFRSKGCPPCRRFPSGFVRPSLPSSGSWLPRSPSLRSRRSVPPCNRQAGCHLRGWRPSRDLPNATPPRACDRFAAD